MVYSRNHPESHDGKNVAAKLLSGVKPFSIDHFLTPVTARFVDPLSGNFVTRIHVPEIKPETSVHD